MIGLSEKLLLALGNPETPDWAVYDLVCEENPHVAAAYVVYGHRGTHSDYRTWHVAAFLLEEQAAAFAETLNRWAKENSLHEEETEFNGYVTPRTSGGGPGGAVLRSNYDTRSARADALNMDDWDYNVLLWKSGPDQVVKVEVEAGDTPPTDVAYGVLTIPLRAG